MDQLKEIVARVLDIKIDMIDDNLKRDDTEKWDSFNHLLLISEIEKNLGVKFSISDVEKIKSFKELRQIVSGKKGREQ